MFKYSTFARINKLAVVIMGRMGKFYNVRYCGHKGQGLHGMESFWVGEEQLTEWMK